MEMDPEATRRARRERIEADDGPKRAPLRALPSSVRLLAVLSFAAAASAFVGLTAARHDLATYPASRLAPELLVLGATLTAVLALALRPAHRPALQRSAVAVCVAATLLVAVLVACVPPPVLPTGRALLGPAPRHGWASGLPCLSVGLLVALPIYFVARAFDGGRTGSRWLAAAAAAIAGNLALTLHCPIGDVAHRLFSHASLGFLLLACLASATLLERAAGGEPT